MSEPTYRIELTHRPEEGLAVAWHAGVYDAGEWVDNGPGCFAIFHAFGADREAAFDNAQAWCKAKATEPHAPSTVFLTEDGDIHDPHDQPNLRSVS